jgi:deoxyguanosine kinase
VASKKIKNKQPRLIAIEGPIGVGKTTLARFLADRLKARVIYEEVEENPFLQQFYSDPRRTAFQTQMFFLLSRYQQQLELKQEDLFCRTTICDYVFQKDRIFACVNLTEPELALYDRIYRLLDQRVPNPDLVVYLQARPSVLLERLKTRNRSWERPIKQAYLERVVTAYNDYFFHYKKSPLLVVNTSDIDIVENDGHLESVLSEIRRMRKGVQHFNPAPGK